MPPQPAPPAERPRPYSGRAAAQPQHAHRRPLLRYDYRLPAGMASLPLTEPCLRYEFELRHLGRLGQLALHWQGAAGSGSN